MPYADITDPQSLNKYTYTYNNPLRYVDPDGHGPEAEVAGLIEEYAAAHPEAVDAALAGISKATTAVGAFSLGTGLRIFGGAAGFFGTAMLFPSTVGGPEADKPDATEQAKAEPEQQGAEPQTATGGARQGGGRNAQKSNTNRADSAKDKLVGAKRDLAAAKKLPPSKARSESIKRAEKQVKHWQGKAAEKSEIHSRKPKGQQ